MNRITATPNYAVHDCSDLCGFLPRRHGDKTGEEECLIQKSGDCSDCIILKAFQRLKQYEDTGFAPEQIVKLTTPIITPEDLEKFWGK